MAFVDDRGRLFGRINLIDALVGGLAIAIIPLAYAGYALFRQPQPTLVGVEPATITPTTTHVTVRGQNLRPFLRVSFDQRQGVTFALSTPTTAEVKLPELPAGKYDLILYDVAREVSRLPGAVTVEAAPLPSAQASMLVSGAFVALDDVSAAEVVKGAEMTAMGGDVVRILDVGAVSGDSRWVQIEDVQVEVPLEKSRRKPALLQARCTIADRRCQVGAIDIERLHALSVFTKSGRPLRFVVEEGVADGPTVPAELRVRALMHADAVPAMRAGDRDKGSPLLGSRLATVSAVGPARRTSGDMMWHASVPGAQGDWSLTVPEAGSIVDATVNVLLDRTTRGYHYRGHPVRVGAPFVLETERYVLKGVVLRIDLRGDATPSPATSQP
jgi:hypothetical protein